MPWACLGPPRPTPFPTGGVATLASDHFTVHYFRELGCPSAAITQENAGDVLGMAERAYSFYSAMGYTVPASTTDISVDDFTIGCFAFGFPRVPRRRLWTAGTPYSDLSFTSAH